ncbi:uncharacterized protein E0L32_000157 [Thyridium curvatum]|uniref:rRNA methyltransferase 2, mitochondrial n=1 Tax=Thyridium curvatum TaxID=1093900 RepID=A0A507B804_9PEZI|nr:uncharacterized protein E0L32_000157 [Thyridium curvatum]TPX15823.1 hypothetical protein E0L32_000157 [Thyridium curvatum]
MIRRVVRSWARPTALAMGKLNSLSIDALASHLSRASIAQGAPRDICHRCWQRRAASTGSSASSRWKQRQGKDFFAREAKVQGLKSRAAFKLLEIDAKYRIFKRGQSVVDLVRPFSLLPLYPAHCILSPDISFLLFVPYLIAHSLGQGYAPGSWSQVAAERTKPTGRILGIDLIPAQPPRGVSTIQGDFLSPHVQHLVKQFLADDEVRRKRHRAEEAAVFEASSEEGPDNDSGAVVEERPSYIDLERHAAQEEREAEAEVEGTAEAEGSSKGQDKAGRLVDVSNPPLFFFFLLSQLRPERHVSTLAPDDRLLSEHVDQPVRQDDEHERHALPRPRRQHGEPPSLSLSTLSIPHVKEAFRPPLSSENEAHDVYCAPPTRQDLCTAALSFANDTLRAGGHFVCKFYQGAEDKTLERRLRKLFAKVHREKPDSSRSESKEAFFVALRRKGDVVLGVEDLEPPI